MGTRLMDSVPPATIVPAPPLITRSAANAIACRPDEQKRLIVTADADTGMPARRLAIRATFRPCSASGIAQPRITSSTSAGLSAGARRSASAIAVAASSSGRVPRSAPFGALPTAVRTAETITASCISSSRSALHPIGANHSAGPITEQIFDRVADLAGLAVEQMIRRVNHDELLRLLAPRIELLNILQRTELVA